VISYSKKTLSFPALDDWFNSLSLIYRTNCIIHHHRAYYIYLLINSFFKSTTKEAKGDSILSLVKAMMMKNTQMYTIWKSTKRKKT